jgi:hypothetical protein
MIDSTTHERITVHPDGDAGPYMIVPVDQRNAIEVLLKQYQVQFWVDDDAISLNGKPEVAVVNFGRGADVSGIQELLDGAD